VATRFGLGMMLTGRTSWAVYEGRLSCFMWFITSSGEKRYRVPRNQQIVLMRLRSSAPPEMKGTNKWLLRPECRVALFLTYEACV